MMPSYDHIHLRNLGLASERFQTTDTGRTKYPVEVDNRRAHGTRLVKDLRELRAMFGRGMVRQRDFGVPEIMRGRAVVIQGRPGQPLDVGPRQLERQKLSVLGIRRTPNGDRHEARIFFTEAGFDTLLNRAEKYREWQPGKSRRPDNFYLFEGTERFRLARIEDYWNDEFGRLPVDDASAEWEVWTRDLLDHEFNDVVDDLELDIRGVPTSFEDLKVYNLVGTRRDIEALIEASAAVVELRGASSFDARDRELPSTGHAHVRGFAERLVAAKGRAPIVTLLDTGVNRDHPLLQSSLPMSRCHAAEPSWDPLDSNGHGTKMAGIALFGDLGEALGRTGPINLPIRLESVVVSAPGNPVRLPARDALARGVGLVERKQASRVYCLAATAVGEPEAGHPTSTSATLDQLAFGDGDATRLFCTAVGNVATGPNRPYSVAQYGRLNEEHRVQSPAQALNALSVGAATQKCSVSNLVAPSGGLSPTSRTSLSWDDERPHKPDIVMEGGNHLIDQGGRTSTPHPPDMLITTGRDVAGRPITVTGETSAATAAAARLAALVMRRYPEMRPETVRGLLVNSARWTGPMQDRFEKLLAGGNSSSQAAHKVLSCYGWGIPDQERLFESADNALTLVVEDTLRPYERAGSRIRLREMKYFRLPWPDAALDALGATEVEVRCTLSYFAEPDPGSVSRDEPMRYPGHRLKFDFKRYDETDEQAQRRFNKALQTDLGGGDETGWLLGRYRARGTLHQDIWRGPAYQLRQRNGISVAPNHGWWSTRVATADEKIVPFSLIVTVTTPTVRSSLFTEALAKAPAGALVNHLSAKV